MHEVSLIGANGRIELPMPGTWEELTQEQFCALAQVRVMATDPNTAKTKLLHVLSGMSEAQFASILLEDLLEICTDEAHNERVEACPYLNWALETPALGRSMLPQIELDGRTWQGPKAALGNFTVLQFSFADLCLEKLQADPTEKALNNILGALYHEHGMLWCNEGIEKRGEALSAVPMATKLGAVLNYQLCRASLPLTYPKTFKATDESEGFGIDGLLEGLAGDKFGPVDQVGGKPLHPALVHCERALIQEEKLKRKAQERK